jgi:Nucleotidyltransferase
MMESSNRRMAAAAGKLPVDEQLAHLLVALRENRTLIEVLNHAEAMNLPGWYLVAGCLYQTVWNVVTGQPAEAGISRPSSTRSFSFTGRSCSLLQRNGLATRTPQ